jgi:hypothetical protein
VEADRPQIGFTNRTIRPWWRSSAEVALSGHTAPSRIRRQRVAAARSAAAYRPEVVFKLSTPVLVIDDADAILHCIEWMAPGFEIVQSHFPVQVRRGYPLHLVCTVRWSGAPVAITDESCGHRRRVANVHADVTTRQRRDR